MTDLNPFLARGLPKPIAAAYVGMPVSKFEQEVEAKRLPAAMFANRRPAIWDRVQLDEALDKLGASQKKSLAEAVRNEIESKAHQAREATEWNG